MEPHYYKALAEEALGVIEARRQFLPVAHDPAFHGVQTANSVIAEQAQNALYDGRPVLIVPPDRADLAASLAEGRYPALPEGTAMIYSGSHSPFSSAEHRRATLESMFDTGKPNKVISELGGFYIEDIAALGQDGEEQQ